MICYSPWSRCLGIAGYDLFFSLCVSFPCMGGLSNLVNLANIALLLLFLGFYYGNFLEQRNWAHLFVPGILHSGGQLGLVKGAGVHTIPFWECIVKLTRLYS